MISSNILINKIEESTRISNTTHTMIDPILATMFLKICELDTISVELFISDHMTTLYSFHWLQIVVLIVYMSAKYGYMKMRILIS